MKLKRTIFTLAAGTQFLLAVSLGSPAWGGSYFDLKSFTSDQSKYLQGVNNILLQFDAYPTTAPQHCEVLTCMSIGGNGAYSITWSCTTAKATSSECTPQSSVTINYLCGTSLCSLASGSSLTEWMKRWYVKTLDDNQLKTPINASKLVPYISETMPPTTPPNQPPCKPKPCKPNDPNWVSTKLLNNTMMGSQTNVWHALCKTARWGDTPKWAKNKADCKQHGVTPPTSGDEMLYACCPESSNSQTY
jgi:hypothetical protein